MSKKTIKTKYLRCMCTSFATISTKKSVINIKRCLIGKNNSDLYIFNVYQYPRNYIHLLLDLILDLKKKKKHKHTLLNVEKINVKINLQLLKPPLLYGSD